MEQTVAEATFSWQSLRYFIVGSLADGWGNSLVSLSGGTDSDSDIDATQLYSRDFVYHIRDYCQCDCSEAERLEYRDGHLISSGASASPAQMEMGSSVRPALDLVNAYKCCCYPKIALLQPGYETNIPETTLQSLRNEMKTSICHVVCAAAPGQEGQQLRVSTTFLERCLMRSLSSEQGQLFVILKYIVKKVLAKRARGLKTYNAKTLLFCMLDETPIHDWRPDRLVHLVDRAIRRLIADLEDARLTEHQSGWHFFLPDA
uniref:Mab-21 domain-containing protein n=1 Tax=Macrostomum lignano TaxID=282301 RepID=A0A1I8GUL5_9PLAT